MLVPVAATEKVTTSPKHPDVPEGCVLMDITGLAVTVKSVALVAVLPAMVTLIGPVVAPAGTVVVMDVVVLAVTTAVVPLNVTVLFAGVVLKLVPLMITDTPTGPEVGSKPEMVGVGRLSFKTNASSAPVPDRLNVPEPGSKSPTPEN